MTDLNNQKFKVFYREIDKDRNPISETKVLPKEYTYHGHAINYARKELYHRNDGKNYTFRITKRDPWSTYSTTTVCDVCSKQYTTPETVYGTMLTDSIHFTLVDHANNRNLYTKDNPYSYINVCPECRKKITNFIDSLKEGNDD